MPMYDCVCNSGHKFEKLLKIADKDSQLVCPECGEKAHTVISPVRSKLDGTTLDFPGAYYAWENKRKPKGL